MFEIQLDSRVYFCDCSFVEGVLIWVWLRHCVIFRAPNQGWAFGPPGPARCFSARVFSPKLKKRPRKKIQQIFFRLNPCYLLLMCLYIIELKLSSLCENAARSFHVADKLCHYDIMWKLSYSNSHSWTDIFIAETKFENILWESAGMPTCYEKMYSYASLRT